MDCNWLRKWLILGHLLLAEYTTNLRFVDTYYQADGGILLLSVSQT